MVKDLKDYKAPLTVKDMEDKPSISTQYVMEDAESKIVKSIIQRFKSTAEARNKEYEYFNNRTLVEYIDDSVGRYNALFDERDGLEDWQARVNVPMTQDKVATVLGKMVSMMPIAEITARNGTPSDKVALLSDLYQYAEDIDDYDELMICATLEAIVKGTVIGYEGYNKKEKKQRTITGYNKDGTPKFKVETIRSMELPGSIIPLEDFYPSSVTIRRISDMPYVFIRRRLQFSAFVNEFGSFDRATLVEPKQDFIGVDDKGSKTIISNDLISEDIEDGFVEVLYYFNQLTDEYIVIANGIWLNPLPGYSVAPLPCNHKTLPFWSARFNTAGSDFFYGKSLVNKLMALQDVLNVLTNMALDQSFLTIFPPVLTAGIDPIEDDYLRPGRRVPVDTQGLPLNQAFMKLDLGTPSGWHQWMIDYVGNIMEQASVDQVSSGQAGVGGRTTAVEIRQAAAGVAAILGVFGKLLNSGIKRKAKLKCFNILQFWTSKDTPIVSKIIGQDRIPSFKNAFNIISREGTTLSDGKFGDKILAMYDGTESMPSKSEVKTDAMYNQLKSGTPTEIIAIDANTLRDLDFDIKFVPNLKSDESKEIQKALMLEKTNVYMKLFPSTVNTDELQSQIARMFGDDPKKMFKQPERQQPQQPQQQPGISTGASQNMVQQMMGGQEGDVALRDLGL